jgi:membrane-bound serine protease (ClpP class)
MMDFLLNPNIAYLILVGGILLGLLAVVTPGTGALELGAAFCFLLAGYAIYNLSVNWWALVVLLLSIFPFIYAIKSRKKLFLGIAIVLLVGGSAFLFSSRDELFPVNLLVAFATSGLLAVFCWVVAVKFLETLATRPTHDLEALIGQVGEARTAIHADGSVQVDGELWSARSEKKIASGSHVRVIRREGFTLVVEKIE